MEFSQFSFSWDTNFLNFQLNYITVRIKPVTGTQVVYTCIVLRVFPAL